MLTVRANDDQINAQVFAGINDLRGRRADHRMHVFASDTNTSTQRLELLYRLTLRFTLEIHAGLGIGRHVEAAVNLGQWLHHRDQRQLGAMIFGDPLRFFEHLAGLVRQINCRHHVLVSHCFFSLTAPDGAC